MDRLLRLSAPDQRMTFEQAAARRGLPASSVEKDFWVCWVLGQVCAIPDLGPSLTFKGGTSLSKAWGLIDRFSEDIDLTIDRDSLGFGGEAGPERGASSTQQAKRMKALRLACRNHVALAILPALEQQIAALLPTSGWSLGSDEDDADCQTLLLHYPTHFPVGDGRYVRPVVKLEFGARSDPWPAELRIIRPVIAEVFPDVFAGAECSVRALSPKRTFWEKAMLVHEETFRPNDKPRKPRMARHYYDLHRLIEAGVAEEAARDIDLFGEVAQHRQVFYAQSWVDYGTLVRGSLRLEPLPGQELAWRQDYEAMKAEMFSTTPPSFDTVLASVRTFERTFNAVD